MTKKMRIFQKLCAFGKSPNKLSATRRRVGPSLRAPRASSSLVALRNGLRKLLGDSPPDILSKGELSLYKNVHFLIIFLEMGREKWRGNRERGRN